MRPPGAFLSSFCSSNPREARDVGDRSTDQAGQLLEVGFGAWAVFAPEGNEGWQWVDLRH